MDERVECAVGRQESAWPIPIQCFWGLRDRIVPEASARGAFDELLGIDGDHFSVLTPRDRKDESYGRLADALIEPLGHRHVFELESYDATVKVGPFPAGQVIADYGDHRRTVFTDNVARITRTLRLARKNRCREPIEIRYGTQNDGFVKPLRWSHDNVAPPEIMQTYYDSGTKYFHQVRPDGNRAETYSVELEIYKGFDQGSRNIHFHLDPRYFYRRLTFGVDLTSYLAAGYDVCAEPKLYFHPHNVRDHMLCTTRGRGGEMPAVAAQPPGVWRWELREAREGVVDIAWDVAQRDAVPLSPPSATTPAVGA
jgi:hypothetical protein